MILNFSITLVPENGSRLYHDLAYPLYGELLRRLIHIEFAERLHETGYTPLSQYLDVKRSGECSAIWHLSVFGNEAITEFKAAINTLTEINLKDSNTIFKVKEIKESQPISYEYIIKSASEIINSPYRTLKFVTPTSFKSADMYTLFPSSDLIIKSLIAKWNSFCENYSLDDEDMLQMLLDGVEISSYRLTSTSYRLKGQRIRSFIGTVGLTARLAAPLMEVFKTLLLFGEYSGIGIKTALGMGGMRIIT